MRRKRKKLKYSGNINLERILLYDPPLVINETDWNGPFIRTITKEEFEKLYPKKTK